MAEAKTRPVPFRDFLHRKDGATAIEYALIACLVVLAIVVAAAELGRQVGRTWNGVAEEVTTAGE